MSVTPSRLPPYGKILKAYLDENVHLKDPIYIYTGEAASERSYSEKCLGQLCCYLPVDQNYHDFHWPIFKQKIIVYDLGGIPASYLKNFCSFLITFKPKVVYLFSEVTPGLFFTPEMESSND